MLKKVKIWFIKRKLEKNKKLLDYLIRSKQDSYDELERFRLTFNLTDPKNPVILAMAEKCFDLGIQIFDACIEQEKIKKQLENAKLP